MCRPELKHERMTNEIERLKLSLASCNDPVRTVDGCAQTESIALDRDASVTVIGGADNPLHHGHAKCVCMRVYI